MARPVRSGTSCAPSDTGRTNAHPSRPAGWVIYRWRRRVWAVLFGLSVFGFIHILIGPNTGYLSDLSVPTLMAALGVFALFGAFSILFWAYFRFRPARREEQTQG